MIKVRTRWAWVAAFIGLVAAQACDQEDARKAGDGKADEATAMGTGEEDTGEEDRSAMSCADYCASVMACHDDITEEFCLNKCANYVIDCMGDDETLVLGELEACAMEPCETLDACTVGAGLACTAGK